MNNYKITNLRTNKSYFLNDEETTNFFVKNKAQNYSITNLTKQKRKRVNKILDNIQLFCFFALTILTTIYIIENFY
tara:strand:+ start:714 stop:941 length:228 start_codon:yes stop_codon:yes gene_type:complete